MKAVLAMLLLAACISDDSSAPAPGAPPPSAAMTGKLPLKMHNCPSAVPGATTRAIATKKGIDLEITVDDPAARREIIARADRHADMRGTSWWFMPPHSGMHGGPGAVGRCPVIHAGTRMYVEGIAGGVKIHMIARDHAQVRALQQAVQARMRALRPQS